MRRRQWAHLCAVCALLVAGAAGAESQAEPSAPLLGWRPAPAYLPLFTAERTHPGAYRTYVSPRSIGEVLRDLSTDPAVVKAPGSWLLQTPLPLDALGRDGLADRYRIVRLYGARRPLTARGLRRPADGGLESWTLISPYPGETLRTLEPGTLLIVLRLP